MGNFIGRVCLSFVVLSWALEDAIRSAESASHHPIWLAILDWSCAIFATPALGIYFIALVWLVGNKDG